MLDESERQIAARYLNALGAFRGRWAEHLLDGERGRVLEALGILALSGQRPSLTAAARLVGFPRGTVTSWAVRDEDFANAVRFWRSAPRAEPDLIAFDAEQTWEQLSPIELRAFERAVGLAS
jgi:hypothetical protein